MVADFNLDELCAAERTSWSETEFPLATLRVFQLSWDLVIVEKTFSERSPPRKLKSGFLRTGQKVSQTGNRTRVFHVTGGDTHHYTIWDML
ncbi:hypothetical protein RvY_15384 [Ramazzottius varieornatus]|uniref:Uncharacterized protein n=1 Tax=Ramazzottius varieornatus TaxID=947166 RepID=A0A1D1VUQ8_RAMVA|nr:hypothetical protein RvY_15384 [Ramazzottius varieornatus]